MKTRKENSKERSHAPLSSIAFEVACIRANGSSFSKVHGDVLVTMTRKEIFVGRDGNWKVKWSDVLNLELTNQVLSIETAKNIFDLKVPEESAWPKFQTLLKNQWNKVQGLDDYSDRVSSESKPSIIPRRKPSLKNMSKRMYGSKSSRHNSILQSALRNKDIQWSDEEQEITTKSFNSPSRTSKNNHNMGNEQNESVPPENNDDVSVVMSDDTGDEPKLIQDSFQKSETKRKRRIVRKQILKNDDSEDETFFQNSPITTQIGSCLVTPGSLNDDDHDESSQESQAKQPVKKFKVSVDDQKKLSDFFSLKSNKLKQALPAKILLEPANIKAKIIPHSVGANSLERDHLNWVERTPPKSSLQQSLDVSKHSSSPDLFEKPPSKPSSEIFLPPKTLNTVRDSIEDSDDDEQANYSQTKVQMTRRRFSRPARVYGKSKADYFLDAAATAPRKISFDRSLQYLLYAFLLQKSYSGRGFVI
jgi:hypothetical protein